MFTQEQALDIVRNPVIRIFMLRGYVPNVRDFDVKKVVGYSRHVSFDVDPGRVPTIYVDRDLQEWPYLSKPIDCTRFLLLRAHVESSLIASLRESDGIEQQRLLAPLRMTSADDKPHLHCHAVAIAAEDYMVGLQHGASGIASYRRFMAAQIKSADRIRLTPPDLDTGE